MKFPNANHPITIEPAAGRVRVWSGGKLIADTGQALTMHESDYSPVHYIPLRDVNTELLEPSDKRTYCPYKGDATYFSIAAGGERVIDAVWTYETPYEAVAEIKGHVAFYSDRVDTIELASTNDIV
jgi:uncharacterized protein (DUF427 family)